MSVTLRVRRSGRWVEIGVLLAILAVAAFFRLRQLDSFPPGMTHDEAAFGAEAEQILAGDRPLYFSLGYGHEPLYAYLVAVAFALLGRTLAVMRGVEAICGLLIVLGTYLMARQIFGVRIAAISAAWIAVAFWPASLSREALRAVPLATIWLPAAWWFWRGVQAANKLQDGAKPWRSYLPSFAVSGLFLGVSFYTYYASRVVWAVFPLFVIYLLIRKETRATFRRIWPGLVMMLVIAALVASPLAAYLLTHPGIEMRMSSMMGSLRDLAAGKPQRILRHVWNAVRVFSWVGDPFWAYNISGRPILNWLGSLCLYAGLLTALWRWRDLRYAFLLIWFGVGMGPALVTTNEGILFRAIVAQPAVYVLVGVGLATIGALALKVGSRLRLSLPRPWPSVLGCVVALALVGQEGVRSYRMLFVDWPTRPEVRNIYNYHTAAIARYLRAEPAGSTVGISALYPLYYHDPWIVRYLSGRSNLDIRWFDGRGGIVYPSEGEARYVFSAATLLDPALRAGFEAQATLVERVELGARDLIPYFEVWHWQGQDALSAHLEALSATSPMWVSPQVRLIGPATWQPVVGSAPFGDVMALVGYRLNGQVFKPGDVVELVSYWRALRTVQAEDDWSTFVHLLDRDSQVMGGVDVLHCPPTGWYPGDIAVQVHRLTVGKTHSSEQEMYLEIGVYRRTASRLSVRIDGQVAGDRLLLSPVRISSRGD